MKACYCGRVETVKILLAHPGIDIHILNTQRLVREHSNIVNFRAIINLKLILTVLFTLHIHSTVKRLSCELLALR